MVSFRRSKRVRLHLKDDSLPRIDGLLVSRRNGEYTVAVPSLLFAADGNPVTPEGRFVATPKSGVAFLEIL